MRRYLNRVATLAALAVLATLAYWFYERNWSSEAYLRVELERLEAQRKHLQEFVTRLSSEKRVADLVVTDQTKTGSVIESTTLMFVEYGRDGSRLPPRFFTIKGNVAHVDSLVIKFERGFLEAEDPLKGHSLVLFYRLYGDYQSPAEGFRIDPPNQAPEAYKTNISLAAQAFEAELWRNFWKLADDAKYREEKGVRVAQGESPWTRFYPDRIYTLSLEAAGGLSLVARPMDDLFKEYRDAIRRMTTRGANNG